MILRGEILIRFDDSCPTMDYIEFNRVVDVLERHGVKPFLRIIPDCKDSSLQIGNKYLDFWNYMKSLACVFMPDYGEYSEI